MADLNPIVIPQWLHELDEFFRNALRRLRFYLNVYVQDWGRWCLEISPQHNLDAPHFRRMTREIQCASRFLQIIIILAESEGFESAWNEVVEYVRSFDV